jgi:hypothetical protein
MSLTDLAICGAKPSPRLVKLSDGGGLRLWITPIGSKLWRLAYRFAGKQKKLSFGAYQDVSVREARERRDEAKRLLRNGVGPAEHKRQAKISRDEASTNTFSAVTDDYLAKLAREGRARTTIDKTTWLLDFARPVLGNRPINEITPPEVLAVLRKVEARGRLESARRLRGTIGSVFRYAIATARAANDPTLAPRGALTVPTVKPRAAVTEPKAFGALLRAIDGFDRHRTGWHRGHDVQ